MWKNKYILSSANSINWGRLAPQIVYYVSAYCDMIASGEITYGEKVNVCVPTGNFGNIFAAYIAKAAVCDGEDKPCDKCSNCHLACVGSHPDIITISPPKGKKSITINEVRQIRNDAYVKPHKAGKKVFIIEGADVMPEQHQNALLKVIEEPPADIVTSFQGISSLSS